jgi:hypothetical protein
MMLAQIPIGTFFCNLLSEITGEAGRTRAAAELLCDATLEYRKAAMGFESIHGSSFDATADQIAEYKRLAIEKMDAAFRIFAKDYDWPDPLLKVVKEEIRKIDLEIVNMKASSLTGQHSSLESSVDGILTACEKIHAAAKPYTLGFWPRLRASRKVMPAKAGSLRTTDEKGWWTRWWAAAILFPIATTVIAELIFWGITREYDRLTPVPQISTSPSSPSVAVVKTPNTTPQPPSVKIEQHGNGNSRISGTVIQGPCSVLQNGGNNNQARVNCAPEWHLSDVQRKKWSDFVVTLPQQCAEIVVVGDIPDKNSHDFATDIFNVLNEHHKVNRFGHLLSGDFGEGITVQVHDENDVNLPTAKLIVSAMQNAGVPVAGLSANPNIQNHEIHIIVAYKPSR